MDIQDYSQQLLSTAKEFKGYAFQYKKERALYSEALNKLISLINKSGLSDDKSAFENKLPKLLKTVYANEAQFYIEQLNTSRGNYKGWEQVLEAYRAEVSAIQSVIKYNLQGELAENIAQKVRQDEIMTF